MSKPKNTRKYFFHRYDENNIFAFRLYYVETEEEMKLLPEGAQKVSYRRSQQLAVNTRVRRKSKHPFASFGDTGFVPANYDGDHDKIEQDSRYELVYNVWVLKALGA